jgi:hypothetical protein
MSLAEKYCLTAAFLFFMTGLLTGVWKYRHIARSQDATAPIYVDIAHRSSLLYGFAAILLGQLAAVSQFSAAVNAWAALVALVFFAFAILSYVIHGLLRDTDNQFRRPHVLGRGEMPRWLFGLFMGALVVGEIGGSAVLGAGALLSLWS